MTTLLTEIIAFLLGRKYYANIINTRGTSRCELSCHIFRSASEADRHRRALQSNRSFAHVETISFRSRREYNSPQI